MPPPATSRRRHSVFGLSVRHSAFMITVGLLQVSYRAVEMGFNGPFLQKKI